jgi:hypothetical protein
VTPCGSLLPKIIRDMPPSLLGYTVLILVPSKIVVGHFTSSFQDSLHCHIGNARQTSAAKQRLISVLQLPVTANVVPSSLILFI